MRLRATSRYVLALPAVIALCAVIAGPSLHVQAGQTSAPQPVAVTLDPGHGGLPSTSDPTAPFDPGAIGVNGVLEKDVTLDVARRTAVLLREDMVDVSLTRNDDRFVTIDQREQVAIDAHAAVFVSVHCNMFKPDPSVGGSLVLYPNEGALQFAETLSGALQRGLAPAGVAADGVQLRDNWWIHAPMPTATVEMAYLSNPHEAALMASPEFREAVAASIRDGIERFDPGIQARKAAIIAWDRAHAVPPAPAAHANATTAATSAPASNGSPLPLLMVVLLLLAGITAMIRWRHSLPLAALDAAAAIRDRVTPASLRHSMARRRRRRTLSGRFAQRAAWPPRSVYDELSF